MTAGDATVRPGRTLAVRVLALDGRRSVAKNDAVATEEPLEIRLSAGGNTQSLATTMRTPGNDFELAAGFVFGEGVVVRRDDVREIRYCLDADVGTEQRYNVVTVELAAAALPDIRNLERHFTVNSACGVCGRAHLDALRDAGIVPVEDAMTIDPELLYDLPQRMRTAQRVFETTGGLHAAALFDDSGNALAVREDIGRHNAVDKLSGWGLMNGSLPFSQRVLMVSGRAGYEIVQKAIVARIPIVCSVSAPSSLAVDLAREFHVTLAGFVRDGRANVYSATERIATLE
ncbi:MAG TPA: formate dehydrogenase accessory sulfurtransferase FdhD [Candidatus Tumulicola sp.]|jgi:FdhD protein